MNELVYNLVIGLVTVILSGYILIGLMRHWIRSDKFILINRIGIDCWASYLLSGFLLTIVTFFIIVVSSLLRSDGVLFEALIGVVIIFAAIYTPRFVLDISRGLRYNAKTGELARIKELEDQLKNR